MSTNPRSALDRLIGALEAFHQAASNAQDPDAPSVVEASDALADAYTVYDDVLFTQFGIEAPLDVYGDYEDEDDEEDDDLDYDEDIEDDDIDEFDLDDDDVDDLDDLDEDFLGRQLPQDGSDRSRH